jgi:hypothetical protein
MSRFPAARLRAAVVPLAAAALLAACAPQPPKPFEISEAVTATATVVDIDPRSRTLLLKDASGTQMAVQAGPEVRNFDQIKVGDRVVATYREAFAAEVVKPGSGQTGAAMVAGRAEPGQRPGMAVGDVVTTTVKVWDVDTIGNIIEYTDARGYNRRLKVRDPKAIAFIRGLRKGDEVQVTFTEAAAISVQPAAAPK